MPAVSKTNAKALAEKRADLIQKAQLFVTEHEDAEGLLGAEDQATVDTMLADAAAIKKQWDTRTALETAVDGLDDPAPAPRGARQLGRDGASEGEILVRQGSYRDGKPDYVAIRSKRMHATSAYHEAFQSSLIYGDRAMNLGKITHEQFAALQSDDPAQAGYLIASEQFAADILKTVDDFCQIRKLANITTVPTADSLGIRARKTKMSTWGWSSEITLSTADAALAYGKKVLTPHSASGAALVSRDLIRRLPQLAESEIRHEMGRDSSELMENGYLTGNGAQRPLGVFTASSDGISTARDVQTGSTTSITADGLIKAKFKLKPQYRLTSGARGGARWMFHRDARSILEQLKDGNGNYLLHPWRGITDDQADTLLGLPIDESEFTPNTFTTGLYVGILACWQYYRIADALDMEIQVVDQLYAATNQIGYLGRLKTDGMPVLEEAFVRLILN